MTATVLLVHGGWHGAWAWGRLLGELGARGIPARAIDLPGHGASNKPLGDLYAEMGEVRTGLEEIGGPTVLCGHSGGGLVITKAADGAPGVAHLVYLAAFMPDVGEALLGVLEHFGRAGVPTDSDIVRHLQEHPDGTSTVDPEGASATWYHDCDPDVARAAAERLEPYPLVNFQLPVRAAAWRKVPTTAIATTADRSCPPVVQRAQAGRASCEVIELEGASHSPFLSRPAEVAEILSDIAGRY